MVLRPAPALKTRAKMPWDDRYFYVAAELEEPAPEGRPPRSGEQWRVNFARPDWPMEVVNQVYRKEEGASAEWWTWAPQGEVNMHMPERFGYAQFVGEGGARNCLLCREPKRAGQVDPASALLPPARLPRYARALCLRSCRD